MSGSPESSGIAASPASGASDASAGAQRPGADPGSGTPVAIAARDVSIELGGRSIWSEGNFELPTGGVYAIIGPNGSGKTTMLRALLGLLPVASG